jgi:NAD(P)-dependent dehydrogenase (short-subunit alcohol dehydrogenase family)
MKLKGKTAIITGGGTGIGRATAILFAKEGAKVIIVGRRLKPLTETIELIHSEGGEGSYFTGDVSKTEDVQNIVRETIKSNGKIDILFNNAAVYTGNTKTIVELKEEEWDSTIAINLKGVFLFSKYVIPFMMKNGGGVIVNSSSIAGHIGLRENGAYNAAKGGVELLTKCMALDFAKYNIRVNAVSPGWVEIDLNKEEIRLNKKEILRMHPIGRVGQPEDVAKAVLFLASSESDWVTGSSLIVDGGFTAQ